MARRSTIEDPMPQSELRERGVGFWLTLLAIAVVAMALFSCVGTNSLRMQETESGLRYQALRSGDGERPGPEDDVLVHYESRLEDGTVFGSSYVRGGPTRFTVAEAIPGWAEGLQLMRPGARYRFEIPPELAFGDAGEGDAVPAGSTVIYDVELLDVIAKPDPVSADYSLSQTDSGLQYEMLREGEGTPPGPNDMVLVHYRGSLQDGTVFDSSYDRGQPAGFGVGQVIPGWTEGLQMMKPGSKWAFVIPPQLAYGERGVGPIPPNSELVFEVELLDIQRADDAAGPGGE